MPGGAVSPLQTLHKIFMTREEFAELNPNFPYPEPAPFTKDATGKIIKASPLEDFVATYFKRDLTKKTPLFHRQIDHVLQNPKTYDRTMIVAPRGSAKSHKVSKHLPLYQALVRSDEGLCNEMGCPEQYWPIDQMMSITASADLAELWISKMKWELQNNERLIHDFGLRSTEGEKDGIWRNDHIRVKTKSGPLDILAMGRGSSIRGWRPKLVILDDLEDDESAVSPVQIERITRWLRSTVEGLFDIPECVLLWIGTIISPQCVLDNAINGVAGWSKEDWCRSIFSIEDAKGKSVWRDKFPDEFLDRKKRLMGLISYSCEYLCKPAMALTPVWREEDMQQRYSPSELPPRLTRILSIDPAVSEKETADFTAMIVNGYCFEGDNALNVYKLNAEKGHWKAVEIVKRALDKYKKYQCEVLVLETIAAQEYLLPIIEREAADRGHYVNVFQVKPYKDKVTRARGVAFFFEKGYMWFPEQAVWLDELLNEYKIFPTGQKDDYVDAEQMNLAYMKDDHNIFDNTDLDYIPKRKELACPELGY